MARDNVRTIPPHSPYCSYCVAGLRLSVSRRSGAVQHGVYSPAQGRAKRNHPPSTTCCGRAGPNLRSLHVYNRCRSLSVSMNLSLGLLICLLFFAHSSNPRSVTNCSPFSSRATWGTTRLGLLQIRPSSGSSVSVNQLYVRFGVAVRLTACGHLFLTVFVFVLGAWFQVWTRVRCSGRSAY